MRKRRQIFGRLSKARKTTTKIKRSLRKLQMTTKILLNFPYKNNKRMLNFWRQKMNSAKNPHFFKIIRLYRVDTPKMKL